MTHAYALKAPAQSFTPPAWMTVHNAEVAAGVLVVILLAFAVLRLSKGSKPLPPPPAAKKSGGGKLPLLAVLGGVGFWYWDTHLRHAPAAKAAPAPTPSPVPTPRPTVTQTVAPHVTHVTLPAHFPLTGTQILIAVAVVAVVGYLITRVVVRNVP